MPRTTDLRAFTRERLAPLLLWLAAAGAVAALWVDLGASGPVEAFATREDIDVAPLARGRVASLRVAPGDRVATGQIVATLDPTPLEAQIRVVEADRTRVEAELTLAQAQARRTGLGELADRDALLAEAARDLSEARAEQEARKAELDATERELSRLRGLVDQQLATAETLTTLTVQRGRLAGELRAARAKVTLLEAQAATASAREALDPDALVASTRAPLEAELKVLDSQLLLLRAQRDDLVLRAPIGGQITAVLVQPGEVADTTLPVARLVADNTGHVTACLPEEQLDLAVLGAPVEVAHPTSTLTRWPGRATVLGPVGELPQRCWLTPNMPRWGREVLITLDPAVALIPGAPLEVHFGASSPPPEPPAPSDPKTGAAPPHPAAAPHHGAPA